MSILLFLFQRSGNSSGIGINDGLSGTQDVVENMHAEIELLMLSGGFSRDVAVRMLLNKAAKAKTLQRNGSNRNISVLNMKSGINMDTIEENEFSSSLANTVSYLTMTRYVLNS